MIPKQIKDNFFTIGECLGSGSFGDVYKAKMQDGRDVAIKFERKIQKTRFLQNEIAVYRKLKGMVGFPKSIANGSTADHYFIAVELLGPSLMTFFKSHGESFGLSTVLKIGIQILDRLEILHTKNIVHGDLKPENVVVGYNDSSKLYLIDFGLSTEIENADELRVPFRIDSVRGTLKYMSVGAHQGIVAFQNDIESLGYLLVFLLSGKMPWDAEKLVKVCKNLDDKTIYGKTLALKNAIDEYLQSWPEPIQKFLRVSRNIGHLKRPNYNSLREILK